jgi:PAS domain S-box-containing protein
MNGTSHENNIVREPAPSDVQHRSLQQELTLRDAALDAASTHFLIVDVRDPDVPIVYANRAVALAHGFPSANAMIGCSARELMGEGFSEDDHQRVLRQVDELGSLRAEREFKRPDGSLFVAGFTVSALRGADGVITHMVSVGADITARRENERHQQELQRQLLEQMRERERMAIQLRLAQKLESIGRLAAGLAHEINTPIQYVSDSVHFLRSAFEDLQSLYVESRSILIDDPAAPEIEERLRKISDREARCDMEFMRAEIPRAFERTLEGASRVAGIVRAMKEYAYPDIAEQYAVDLNHALETTLTVASGEYKYAAVVRTEFGSLPPVVCNVGELNQVFLNLIVNAAHAIADAGRDQSSGRIVISTRAEQEHALIVISDNGCGIHADNLDRIFDPFFTTKEVGRGTGQGLSIARAIVVEKHAGRIDVRSAPGEGTCFSIRLPIHGRGATSAVQP